MAHRKHDETATISRRTFLKTGTAAAAAGSFSAGVEGFAHAFPAPKRASEDLFDQLRDAPTTLIIDALSLLGYDRTKLAMSQEVRPVVPVKGTAIGPAVITKYEPSREPTTTDDILKYVFQPVDDAPPGAMWVTAAGTDEILSMFGDVIVLACQKLGLSGLVTDGGCRDIEGMLEVGLPVYARGLCLYGPGNVIRPVAADVPVICGGIEIRPGDIVAADINGVMAFPAEALPDVAAKKKEIEAKEVESRALFEQGKGLVEGYLF